MPQIESRWASDQRYDQVRQKSIHNAFQRREGLADQFLYWRARSMEIDIHHADVFGRSSPTDWSVHHEWYDPVSTVSKLSQVLRTMRGLNRLVPNHEVTTLFIDIKDAFPRSARSRHSWLAFDTLLERHLGSRLFRPRDLLRYGRSTSLRGALAAKGWPCLEELRGRFVVVLTGGTTELANYASSPRVAVWRSAFLSVPAESHRDVPGHGDQVFFNVDGRSELDLARSARSHGFVTRAYYLDNPDLWRQAVAAGVHHLATDNVNERIDPWATTASRNGQPLEPTRAQSAVPAEPGSTTAMWARSGDLWGERDSCHFAYRICTSNTLDNTWTFAISGPGSYTEDFVKGAVMARTSLEPDAPYLAVVRVGSKHGLRAQWRTRSGGTTIAASRAIGPEGTFGRDIDQDTIAHVRLTIDRAGRRCRAWGSYDRRAWVLLGEREFDQPLRYQGLAVSSHDQQRGAKFLFVSPDNAARSLKHSMQIGGEPTDDGWVDHHGAGRWLTSELSNWRPS